MFNLQDFPVIWRTVERGTRESKIRMKPRKTVLAINNIPKKIIKLVLMTHLNRGHLSQNVRKHDRNRKKKESVLKRKQLPGPILCPSPLCVQSAQPASNYNMRSQLALVYLH